MNDFVDKGCIFSIFICIFAMPFDKYVGVN